MANRTPATDLVEEGLLELRLLLFRRHEADGVIDAEEERERRALIGAQQHAKAATDGRRELVYIFNHGPRGHA